MGFEAIDNLPLSLIPRLLDGPSRPEPLALGLDVRNRDFSSANVIELIDRLTRDPRYAPEVLYLGPGTLLGRIYAPGTPHRKYLGPGRQLGDKDPDTSGLFCSADQG